MVVRQQWLRPAGRELAVRPASAVPHHGLPRLRGLAHGGGRGPQRSGRRSTRRLGLGATSARVHVGQVPLWPDGPWPARPGRAPAGAGAAAGPRRDGRDHGRGRGRVARAGGHRARRVGLRVRLLGRAGARRRARPLGAVSPRAPRLDTARRRTRREPRRRSGALDRRH